MSKKGLVKVLVFGSLLAIITKYFYLIIPLALTILVLLIFRKKRLDKHEGEIVIRYQK